MSSSADPTPRTFRSVLPHEPPPHDDMGYVHIQGSFTPKPSKKTTDAQDASPEEEEDPFWETADALQQVLVDRLATTTQAVHVLGLPAAAQEVQILDTVAPFTKIRLVYASPLDAQHVVAHVRRHPLTPAQLFSSTTHSTSRWQFASRPLQWTRITQQSLSTPSWTRSNPPKFRRLLPRPQDGRVERQWLEQERQSTRFVFVTNLLPSSDQAWPDVATAVMALRSVLDTLDASGQGVEIFVSSAKLYQYCHVGMRSATDAQRVIQSLQEQVVEWQWPSSSSDDGGGATTKISSDKLFLDYAAITERSTRQLELRAQGQELERGEPTRPECTSSTQDVHVPGLLLWPDFVTPAEETSLLAVLLGPQAPWAPSQSTPTEGGIVKRRVQHYGYVFDYKTANVLRDRDATVHATCPPLPVLPPPSQQETITVEDSIQQSIQEGRGWNVLAGVTERVRQTQFVSKDDKNNDTNQSDKSLIFPHLNQLTVNHYTPGQGIGSHVDTVSAFGDGLLSLSLQSGIVMEFRNVANPQLKKHLYLPPRSLVAMTGPARLEWEHMIVTRRTDCVDGVVLPRGTRVSLTFRTALALDGTPLPRVVSQEMPPIWGGESNPQVSSSYASTPECERDHVHKVYDAIATQWHHTRGRRGVLWPGATQFLERLPQGSIVADVGCGDGKYFPAIVEAGSYVIGSDISRPLLETSFHSNAAPNNDSKAASIPESRRVSHHRQALCNKPAVAVADCMSVPLVTESCDAAICIAVLHHLSTKERRIRCIQELARIVKSGGVMNIQAWAMDQAQDSKRRFASEDVYVPFNAQPKYLQLPSTNPPASNDATADKAASHDRSTAQVYADAFEGADYDDRKGLVVFQRYCHLYRQGELEELVAQVPEVELVESGFESGNYFVIIQKR